MITAYEFQALLYTYDLKSWLAILGTLLAIPIVMRFLQSEYRIVHIYSWILMTLTGRGKEMFIVNKPSGILMFVWLLGSFILSYAFTSSLIAALSRPAMEKPMYTWQDLLENNYVLLTAQTEFNGIIFRRTTFDDDVMVQDISYFVAVPKMLFTHENLKRTLTPDLKRLTDENLQIF